MLKMVDTFFFFFSSQSYSPAVVASCLFAGKFPLISQYTYCIYYVLTELEIWRIWREAEMLKGNWSHTGRVEEGSG